MLIRNCMLYFHAGRDFMADTVPVYLDISIHSIHADGDCQNWHKSNKTNKNLSSTFKITCEVNYNIQKFVQFVGIFWCESPVFLCSLPIRTTIKLMCPQHRLLPLHQSEAPFAYIDCLIHKNVSYPHLA